MTSLYRSLLKQLSEKIAIYQELIGLLRTEWKCVADYSLGGLQEIANKKETLVLKMQTLEENRTKLVNAIAAKLGIDQEELTLQKLIDLPDTPLKPQLSAHRSTLLKQIETIHDLNEKARNMVDYSSLSIKKSLVFLHTTQQRAEAPYKQNGHMLEGRMQSRMLSTEA